MTELALTLPFFMMGGLFLGFAYILKQNEVAQKIFFMGMAWLMGLMGTAATLNVADQMGFTGVKALARGVLMIGIPALTVWMVYMMTRIFTDIFEKVTKLLG